MYTLSSTPKEEVKVEVEWSWDESQSGIGMRDGCEVRLKWKLVPQSSRVSLDESN